MSQYPGSYQGPPAQGQYGAPPAQGYPPPGYPPQQYAPPQHPPPGQPFYPPPTGQPDYAQQQYYAPPSQPPQQYAPQQYAPPQQQYYAPPPPPQYAQPPYGPSNGVPQMGVYQPYGGTAPPAVSFYASSVPPLPPHQVQAMCNQLRSAMKGLGADHNTIISVIGNLVPEHSAQLDCAYKASFGKYLHEAIESETSGNYGRLAVACCMPLADYDAICLKEAMKGRGSDEDALIEILVGRTNVEMMAIKDAYRRMYNRDLENDVKSETGGNFEKTLVVLLQAQRVEGHQTWDVGADVAALYTAGEGRMGCDPLVFISILCNRSDAHLHAVYDMYLRTHGKSLEKVIKSETGSHLEKVLLSIVKSTKDRAAYIAELIEKSMAGIGLFGNWFVCFAWFWASGSQRIFHCPFVMDGSVLCCAAQTLRNHLTQSKPMAVDTPAHATMEISPHDLYTLLRSYYLQVILVDMCAHPEYSIPGGRVLGRLLHIIQSTPAKALTPELVAANLPQVHDPHLLRRVGEDIIVYDDDGSPNGHAHLVAKALALEARCKTVYYLSGGIRAFANQYPILVKRVPVYRKTLAHMGSMSVARNTNSNTASPAKSLVAASLFNDRANAVSPHPLSPGAPPQEIVRALGNDLHPAESYILTPPAPVDAVVSGNAHGALTLSGISSSSSNSSSSSSGSSKEEKRGQFQPTPPSSLSSSPSVASLASSSSSPVPQQQIQQQQASLGGMVTASNSELHQAWEADPTTIPHHWSLPLADQEGLDTTNQVQPGAFVISNKEDDLYCDAENLLYLAKHKKRHQNSHEYDDDHHEMEALAKQTVNTPEPVLSIKAKQLHLVDAVWYGKVVPFGDVPLPILDDFLYLGSCFAARPDLLKTHKIRRVLRLGWGFATPEHLEEDDPDTDVLDGDVPLAVDGQLPQVPSSSSGAHTPFSSMYTNSHNSSHTGPKDNPNVASSSFLGTRQNKIRQKVIYHDFPIEDSPNEPIRVLFEEATALIEEARLRNERIIVHCFAGVSRSATIVLAYLIKYRRMTLYDAWNLVYIVRPIVRPNDGFARALQEYEKELRGVEAATLPIFWMSESYSYYLEYLEWYARMYYMATDDAMCVSSPGRGTIDSATDDALMGLMIRQYNISRRAMSGAVSPGAAERGVAVSAMHGTTADAVEPPRDDGIPDVHDDAAGSVSDATPGAHDGGVHVRILDDAQEPKEGMRTKEE
ncbi:hypothetical protein SeMB42_g02233 [Synchytrium endobioticum]|uniref:Annexin n=1 Tax=Synchytrium endobioticum TaxID=286115 RepID=A0A507DFX2_9FUNG|nr:hypothetical protein SeMB42_g02233 [Synchytrium endobioticum]